MQLLTRWKTSGSMNPQAIKTNYFKIKLLLTDNFYTLCHGCPLRLRNMEKTTTSLVHDYHSRIADIQNNRKRKSTKQAEPHSHLILLRVGGREKKIQKKSHPARDSSKHRWKGRTKTWQPTSIFCANWNSLVLMRKGRAEWKQTALGPAFALLTVKMSIQFGSVL